MRAIKLLDIDLVSSNVAASTATDWAALVGDATTGDVVKVTTESDGVTALTPVIEYEALTTTSSYPPDNLTEWSEVGATNKWRMFDGYLNTYSEGAVDTNIDVTVDAARTDAVGLFNVEAEQITFQLLRGGTIITEETFVLIEPLEYASWYYWLFREYEQPQTSIIWYYTKYADSQIRVVLTPIGSYAKCGQLAIGQDKELGSTKYGLSISIDDYSVKDTDSLGRTYLKEGLYSDRANIQMWLSSNSVDATKRALTALRGQPAMYDLNNAGKSDFDSLRLYGNFEAFDILVPGPKHALCNIEIKGLT